MGPFAPGRGGVTGRAAALLATAIGVSVELCATGCAYQYDDGLAPLGQREASASASAEASASAAASAAAAAAQQSRSNRGGTSRVPLDQLLSGSALEMWARAMLPDESGQSLAFDTGAVWPRTPGWTTGVDTVPGPATLRLVCRGTGSVSVSVLTDGETAIDIQFPCNQTVAKPLLIPDSGYLDIAFNDPGDGASNIAYRLTRP